MPLEVLDRRRFTRPVIAAIIRWLMKRSRAALEGQKPTVAQPLGASPAVTKLVAAPPKKRRS